MIPFVTIVVWGECTVIAEKHSAFRTLSAFTGSPLRSAVMLLQSAAL